jgi:serine/threonine-protein kinase
MPHPISRRLCRAQSGQRFAVDGQQYILRGKLGDGAVGLVRKAERVSDSAMFAMKLLAPDPKYIEEEHFDDVRARFKREGERGAKLDFYSLLRIRAYSDNTNGLAFDSGSPSNPFLIMDCSTGGSMEDFIRRLHPSLKGIFVLDETRLRIAIQVAEAVQYLHRSRIVHRDIKPSNIFLSSRNTENASVRAWLGDFGVVKWGDFNRSLATGTLTATMHKGLGTMKYMSPEQAVRPKEVSVRSDVFSLGVTLYELFTGQILGSFHHVFELMLARDKRGTNASRWSDLEVHLGGADESIAEMILEMIRKGVSGRPASDRVRGQLIYEYERRFDKPWQRSDGTTA